VTRQVRDQQAPARQEPCELVEVPGRAAEAVDEQERRAVAGREEPDPGSTPVVAPFLEAREKNRSIRHLDRLLCVHYELGGHKAG
jgi:hypothetical protein